MSDLPGGWVVAKLSDLATPRGERVPPADHPDMQFVGLEHVESQTTRILGSVPAAEVKSSASLFRAGDVLYGRLRPYLNKVAKPDFDGLASAEFIVFPDQLHLRSGFLKHRLNAGDFASFATHLNAGDRPRVDFEQIGAFDIALPPPAEQQRIVEKLEELLSDLDAGTAALERARANLKRYRAAVLKAAVEGRLTEKWRAAHPDAELAEKRLERILAGRRKKWEEAQLKKYAEKGQTPPKGWKDRYPKPLRLDVAALPELPNGWVWATVDELCWRVADSDHKMPKGVPDGIPYISTKDFRGTNDIDFEHAKKIAVADFEVLRKKVEPQRGDFLLSRYGTIGELRWLKDEQPTFLASYSIASLKLAAVDLGAWLNVALRSNPIQQRMLSFVRGVAQPDLGLAHIREIPIPVPSAEEQDAIAAEVARCESVLEMIESHLSASEVRGARVRQSILKHAFEGKLVPQDPKDEPASELLARIRAGREG